MQENPSYKWQVAQWLEYKWWQRYLAKKTPADYLEKKLRYWQQLLAQLSIPVVQGNAPLQILDAGCGPAGICMALEGHQVTAIDPLLDRYRELPHFQPEKYPWIHFITQPMEALDETAAYDIIFCMNAINHVNDINRCYDRLVKALKPGGYLVISTDAHRFPVLKKIFQWLPGDALHPVQLDIREYNSLMTQRQLAITQELLYKRGGIFNYHITVARK